MKNFAPLVSAALLAGCLSFGEEIYRPEAKGGKPIESSCGFNQGPGRWDTIEFTKDDLKTQIWARQGTKGLSVSVMLKIPEGTVVQLDSGVAQLTSLSSEKTSSLKAENYWWIEGIEQKFQDINTPITGRYRPASQRRSLEEYVINFRAQEPIQGNFQARLPTLKVDGEPYQLPPIRFYEEKASSLRAINC